MISMLSHPVMAGGPWAEGKGKGYAELSALFNITKDNKDHIYQLYSEVGVTDKLTAKLILPFRLLSSPSSFDPNVVTIGQVFGISNPTIGLKYEFFKEKVVLSAGMDVEFGLIKTFDEGGLRTGFERYTFKPVFAVGWGIEKLYTYAEVIPGFSTNGFGHEMGFVAELGGKIDEQIWLAAYFQIRGVFKNGDYNLTDGPTYMLTGYFRDRQNFYSVGVKFSAILFKGFGLNLGGFYGSSVSQTGGTGLFSFKAGLFYDW